MRPFSLFRSLSVGIAALLFPLWFIAHCISRLTHLGIIRMMAGSFYYTFSLVVNILGLVLGILMLFQPFIALFTGKAREIKAATWVIGILFTLTFFLTH